MADQSLISYRSRWEAVKRIELEEQRAATIELRWKQLNGILRLARGLNLRLDITEDSELIVFERWARLREAG